MPAAIIDPKDGPARLRVGESFALKLVEMGSAGLAWHVEELPACLELSESSYAQPGRPATSRVDDIVVGGPATLILEFTAAAIGWGTLTLRHRRPWERGTAPAHEVSLEIEVIDALDAPEAGP